MKQISVGIIGGGIGGLVTAASLGKFGIDSTVYERSPQLREIGAGMMLWANAARVMNELGLLDKVIALGGPTESFFVRNPNGNVLMDIATGEHDVPSICIPRADLLRILVADFPKENIKLGHEFVRLEQDKSKAIAHFKNGESAEHDILIAADGLRSRVRNQVFGHREPVYRGYTIWRGIGNDLYGKMPPATSSETWGRGKRFGILNSGRGRFTWYGVVNFPRGHRDSADGRKAELLRHFKDWHAPVETLIASTPEELIMKNGGCDIRPMRRWVNGRVALLGDAAHATTPNLGQGGGMAIEDGMVLAKSLAAENSIEAGLRLYEKRRFSRTKQIQLHSRLMGYIAQLENGLIVSLRESLTNILPAAIFELDLKRTISYRT